MTDLGTEFGVEVDQAGVTESHVFVGQVKVLALAAGNGTVGDEVILGENESVRVEKSADAAASPVVIRRGVARPEGFVRTGQLAKLMEQSKLTPFRRWQAYSRQLRKDPALVAYYTFERAGRSNAVLPNLSAVGSALDGQVEGAEWVYGRLPGKYALLFHGPDSGDKVVLPEQERFNFTGPFSVAVWFKVAGFTKYHQGLVTKGDFSWRLQQRDATNTLGFFTNAAGQDDRSIVRANGDTEIADGRWHLAVGVYEPAADLVHLRLYVDGRLDAEQQSPWRLRQTDDPVWLGANSGYPGLEFQGWIDEVAIFARALSAAEAAAMFTRVARARRSEKMWTINSERR